MKDNKIIDKLFQEDYKKPANGKGRKFEELKVNTKFKNDEDDDEENNSDYFQQLFQDIDNFCQ